VGTRHPFKECMPNKFILKIYKIKKFLRQKLGHEFVGFELLYFYLEKFALKKNRKQLKIKKN
jgi:hypothetical protein